MSIKRINPTNMYQVKRNNYSQVVTATGGKQVYVAGIVPLDENYQSVGLDDMKTQVKKILDNIEAALEAAGATRTDVVQINVFVTDIESYFAEGVSDVIEFFGDHKPVSTTVEVL